MRTLGLFLMAVCLSTPALAGAKVQKIEDSVWLIEDHSLPVVTIKLSYEGAGAAYDPSDKPGLASFVGQLLDEGSGDMDSLAFNHALEDHAIHFSADTGQDNMTITVQTLSEFKQNAFDLLTQAIKKPRFDTEAVERIRASIVSDLKQAEDNPGYVASRRWKEIAFPNHPYQHPRRGTEASVGAITQADLKSFAGQHLECPMPRIAVVGDISPTDVKAWLTKAFPEPRCQLERTFAPIADITPPDGQGAVKVEKDVPQTVVRASLPGVKRTDPTYYATAMMVHILGGSTLTSRIGEEIRDKRGLAYYAVAQMEDFDHAAVISAYFATRSAEAQDALNVFLDTIKTMADKGVTQAELEDAKHYITGSFPLEIDNQNALAEYLIYMQHYNLGDDYLERHNRYIEAVTLAQVNKAAKTLLSHSPIVVMVGQNAGARKP